MYETIGIDCKAGVGESLDDILRMFLLLMLGKLMDRLRSVIGKLLGAQVGELQLGKLEHLIAGTQIQHHAFVAVCLQIFGENAYEHRAKEFVTELSAHFRDKRIPVVERLAKFLNALALLNSMELYTQVVL